MSVDDDNKLTRREHDKDIKMLKDEVMKNDRKVEKWWDKHDMDADRRLDDVENNIKGEIDHIRGFAEARSANNRKLIIAVGAGMISLGGFMYGQIHDWAVKSSDGVQAILVKVGELETRLAVMEVEMAEMLCQVNQYGC